jgi:hypothetical protein
MMPAPAQFTAEEWKQIKHELTLLTNNEFRRMCTDLAKLNKVMDHEVKRRAAVVPKKARK